MTKQEGIKMKILELELAIEKANRTIDRIQSLGKRAELVCKITFEEVHPWWMFWGKV